MGFCRILLVSWCAASTYALRIGGSLERQIEDSPSIVIVGIGDSGTRGVKAAMNKLGVAMCNQTDAAQDNKLTMPVQDYIHTFLKASGGAVSQREGYMSDRDAWKAAVQAEREGAKMTLNCALKHRGPRADALPQNFAWGWKNPQHLYLLPVIDAAFDEKQNVVAVARDLRDLCTGKNKHQFELFAPDVLEMIVDKAISRKWIGKPHSFQTSSEFHRCMLFTAAVWDSILEEYADKQNFHIIRIEELVNHYPSKEGKGFAALDALTQIAGVHPRPHRIETELIALWNHRQTYMGRGLKKEMRQTVEEDTATYEGLIHDVMKRLGYHVEHYGLTQPTHPRVHK